MLCSLSTLSPEALSAVQQLEKEIAVPAPAFHCRPVAPAVLSDNALAKLNLLERKIGCCLVAVNA